MQGGRQSHIILTGLPGSGKTTIGRLLATSLERPFIDFDEAIERKFYLSVSQIFAAHGEPAFRAAEAAISAELALNPVPHVLAPGGGWIANREAMAHLRASGRIIYLRISPAGALRRLEQVLSTRPLLAGKEPIETLQVLYEARRPYYERDADLTIDTEGLGTDVVLARVVELVSALPDLTR